MARIVFDDFREPEASAAYRIAFDFIVRSGAMRDEYEASVFLARFLTAMVDVGHSNKILMANRAISAYESCLPECARSPRPQAQDPESMERLLERRLTRQHAGD